LATPNSATQNWATQNSATLNAPGVQPAANSGPPQRPIGQPTGTVAPAPVTAASVLPAASQPAAIQTAAIQTGGLPAQRGNVDQPIERQTGAQQQTDQPFSGRTFPKLSDPISDSDAPAGRSWMEVAQQHGVVVLLLLVVVATAVFTGRDNSVDDPNAAIADAVDLFGVEDGIAVDMPMTGHTHDLKTGVASSPQAALVTDSNDIVAAERFMDQIAATEDPSTSVASLEPPRSAANRNPVASNGFSPSFVAENKFAQQMDAKTVSNRFVLPPDSNSDITFNPPSLEVLADSLPDGDATAAPHSDVGQSPGIQFDSPAAVPSKTPFGIRDWTQYLPELPSATSK
jgi:hypothetical protein